MSLSLNLCFSFMAELLLHPWSTQVDEGLNESDYLSFTDTEQGTPTQITHNTHTLSLRALAVLVIITFSLLPC